MLILTDIRSLKFGPDSRNPVLGIYAQVRLSSTSKRNIETWYAANIAIILFRRRTTEPLIRLRSLHDQHLCRSHAANSAFLAMRSK